MGGLSCPQMTQTDTDEGNSELMQFHGFPLPRFVPFIIGVVCGQQSHKGSLASAG